MDSKYQLTDIVEIVNYGQTLELLDSDVTHIFPNAKLVDTITKEDGNTIYLWDFAPGLKGTKAVIVGIIDNGIRIKYRLMASCNYSIDNDRYLFNEEQLKLV